MSSTAKGLARNLFRPTKGVGLPPAQRRVPAPLIQFPEIQLRQDRVNIDHIQQVSTSPNNAKSESQSQITTDNDALSGSLPNTLNVTENTTSLVGRVTKGASTPSNVLPMSANPLSRSNSSEDLSPFVPSPALAQIPIRDSSYAKNSTQDDTHSVLPTPCQSKKPVEKTKLFEAVIYWGEYAYTVKQKLPETLPSNQWTVIVNSYSEILNKQTGIQPGINNLSLNLDQDNNCIYIKPQGKEKGREIAKETIFRDASVSKLIQYYVDCKIPISTTHFGVVEDTDKPLSVNKTLSPICSIPRIGNTCFIASAVQGFLIYQKELINKASKKDSNILLKLIDDYETKTELNLGPFVAYLKNQKPHWFHNGNLQPQDPEELIAFFREFLPEPEVKTYSEFTYDLNEIPEGAHIVEDTPKKSPYRGAIPLHPRKDKGEITPGQDFSQLIKESFNPKLDRVPRKCYVSINKDSQSRLEEKDVPITSSKQKITKAPDELMIQVGRFQESTNGQKESLKGSIENVLETLILPKEFFENKETPTYTLRSVIRHIPEENHYVAYVRKYKTDGTSSFIKANDSLITDVDAQSVLKEAGEGGYLLFYDKTR